MKDADTVSPNASIEELVNEHVYMHHHQMFPVVSKSNRLEGCVTADQIKDVPREEWPAHRVAEIAKPCSPENTITPDTDAAEALKLMNRSGNTKLMVVDGQRLIAVVALRDLLNYLARKMELEGERGAVPRTAH
jgi:CBS domain-containing protein